VDEVYEVKFDKKFIICETFGFHHRIKGNQQGCGSVVLLQGSGWSGRHPNN